MKAIHFFLLLLIGLQACMATDHSNTSHSKEAENYLSAFPAPKAGMRRHVILLDEISNKAETEYKVELIVGKRMMTDGVNSYQLGGDLAVKPLTGWGFNFYQLETFSYAMSTLIAVPENTKEKEEFVVADSLLIPYNSGIPVVIYTPKKAKVYYRIWSAGETRPVK